MAHTEPTAKDLAGTRATVPLVQTDTARLDAILSRAFLCITEDGERLGLFIGDAADDKLMAFAIVADCSDEDDGTLTAADVPFLTDEQRAYLNGTLPNPRPGIIDAAAIRGALDHVMARGKSA